MGQDLKDAVKKMMDAADVLGAQNVLVIAGMLTPEMRYEEGYALAQQRVAKLAQHRLGVRPLNQVDPGIKGDRPFRIHHRIQPQDPLGRQAVQRLGRQVQRQRQESAGKAQHLDHQAMTSRLPRPGTGSLPQDQKRRSPGCCKFAGCPWAGRDSPPFR